MSKEYQAYKLFAMVYIVLIANVAELIATGTSYYIWFLSSILLLFTILLSERRDKINLIKKPRSIKLTRNNIYIISFVLTYPHHYDAYMHLNYACVLALQITNVSLFFIAYGIEKKDLS